VNSIAPLNSRNPVSFVITTAFSLTGFSSGSFYLVCNGLQNPKTLEPTGSFSVTIYDKKGCGIQTVSSGVFLYLYGIPSFVNVQVLTNVPNAGLAANMTIEVTPTVTFGSGFTFRIAFPTQVHLPSNVYCSNNTAVATAVCSVLVDNVLETVLTFLNGTSPAAAVFAFDVIGASNPVSTKSTDPFSQISASNTLGNLIASYQQTGPRLFATLPAVASGSLAQSNMELGTPAVYTFTYYSVNPMYPGTVFSILKPLEVGFPNAFEACSLIIGGVIFPLGWVVVGSRVNLTTGVTIEIPPHTKISIVISSLTNPTNQSASTFILTSYTDSSWLYQIDTVNSSLVPQFKCKYPCATCPSVAQPNSCLSCLSNLFLNGTACLQSCPVGTSANSHRVCLSILTRYLDVTSYVTSAQPTIYSFEFAPTGLVPGNSSIEITFPT